MTEGNPAIGPVELPAARSLFDRVPGVYAFCREHLFRDDTDQITRALWPTGRPPRGALILELGCGPGFYARRLAARFDDLQVVGVDRSLAQLERARTRAARAALDNCRFDQGDAAALPYPDGRAQAVVLSRLLAVVEDREQVLAEVHRVLSPGGRCFVAEPTSSFRAALPIAAMRLASWLGGGPLGSRPSIISVDRVEVLGRGQFSALVRRQRWQDVTEWADSNYQYALLEKSATVAR